MGRFQLLVGKTGNIGEIKNLLLFSIGKLISISGSSIYTFAMGLYVLKITGSGLSFAAALALGIIPMVLINPFAGVAADRLNKKVLIVSMDLLNFTLLLIIYFLSAANELGISLIYTATFFLTVFTTFFAVAVEAAVPDIVTQNMLININSVSKIIDSMSSILGPMIGGLIFALIDIRLFIVINAISFLLSAVSEIFIDFKLNCKRNSENRAEAKIEVFKDIKEGFLYLITSKDIRGLFIILISLNFFLGFSITVPLPYIINNVLKLSTKEFGIIQGAFPIGMIIGAMLAAKICRKVSYFKFLKGLSLILSLCMVLTALPILPIGYKLSGANYVLYYAVVMVVLGIVISLIDIPIAYIMQSIVPGEYRGRVFSIGISIAKVLLPIGLIASGYLLSVIQAYIIPMIGGAFMLIFGLLSLRGNKHSIDLCVVLQTERKDNEMDIDCMRY